MRYGIAYNGSKSEIAEEIIQALPQGRRLVDLFGGGFAITHCALLSGKYSRVLYNDINPLLGPLIRDAIAGKYNYENFTPAFISRAEFNAKKREDGYIKYCWSFGCNGWDYIYSKEKECQKRHLHEALFRDHPQDVKQKRIDLPERLNHLERIERLQELTVLAGIPFDMTCMDYREYEYQDGDVVYCDIPYQNAADIRIIKQYQRRFDHGAFYAWAISRPFPVYFSSYKLGGIVWERDKYVKADAKNNHLIRREVLYCADNDFTPPKRYYQGYLFE